MKKGQMFTVDFVLGLVGFLFLLLLAVKILMTILPSGNYEALYTDNVYVSEQLVGAGYPSDWNQTTVIVPGLTDAHVLNLTKLQQFDALHYNRTKTLFHITSDYVFFFKNTTDILHISSCVHGYPINYTPATCELNLSSITYDNLVQTTRLIAYNATLVQLVIYSWN